jgi:single-strand DNA-binding protein
MIQKGVQMKDINKAILVGRLGSNPILRRTKSGFPVAQFSVATTRRFLREEQTPSSENQEEVSYSPKQANSTSLEETEWHKVVAWGRQAEVCAQYLKKGNTVYVEGTIRSHPYEDKNGQSRVSFEIQSETISFLGGKKIENNSVGISTSSSESTITNTLN